MKTDAGDAADDKPGPRQLSHDEWAQVRDEVETGGMTIYAVADRWGIDAAEIIERGRVNKWNMPAVDTRRLIIEQLFGVLERQIRHLRKIEMTATGEKEVAVLHKLAVTLDKLVQLDGRNGGGKRTRPAESKDIQDLRRKIAERIDELKLTE